MEHHAGSGQLRRLLDAVISIGSALDLQSVLERIIATATELVGARYGALGVLDPAGTRLVEFITVGLTEEQRAAIGPLPEGHGILGLLIVDPRPVRLADLRRHPDSFGFPANHPVMTSFLGVPISVRGEVFGNLYLCDKVDGGEFTDADEEVVVGIATAAGVAIENARLHGRVAELATLDDRERIARDLHDTVIQRLFAIGLGLQATLPLVINPVVTERVTKAIDDLDATVRDVRAAIFELHTTRPAERSIRQELLQLASESSRTLGFEPVVRFDGPVDTAVDDALGLEVLAVVREALMNIAKHAFASTAHVLVEVRDRVLTVTVTDDGVGFEVRTIGGRGMGNMQTRARRLGGTLTVTSPGRGTVVRWAVPLQAGPTSGSPAD